MQVIHCVIRKCLIKTTRFIIKNNYRRQDSVVMKEPAFAYLCLSGGAENIFNLMPEIFSRILPSHHLETPGDGKNRCLFATTA